MSHQQTLARQSHGPGQVGPNLVDMPGVGFGVGTGASLVGDRGGAKSFRFLVVQPQIAHRRIVCQLLDAIVGQLHGNHPRQPQDLGITAASGQGQTIEFWLEAIEGALNVIFGGSGDHFPPGGPGRALQGFGHGGRVQALGGHNHYTVHFT